TRVAQLSAVNTVSGGVFVREATGLVIDGDGQFAIDVGGEAGNISIVTVDGGILVLNAIRSTATTDTAGEIGNILLESGESAEGTTAHIDVRADILSSNGSISLVAADDILLDGQA